MVVVSHLFSLFRGKFSGDCDLVWSQPPLFWTIYFPTAPRFRLSIFWYYIFSCYFKSSSISTKHASVLSSLVG